MRRRTKGGSRAPWLHRTTLQEVELSAWIVVRGNPHFRRAHGSAVPFI